MPEKSQVERFLTLRMTGRKLIRQPPVAGAAATGAARRKRTDVSICRAVGLRFTGNMRILVFSRLFRRPPYCPCRHSGADRDNQIANRPT
jgi:hypothetical protein